jgi:putative phosphoesterase
MLILTGIKKIGVISDTHIPSRTLSLPDNIFSLFDGMDLIIHCGDLVNADVLTELGSIAPVYAVRGNMDPDSIGLSISEVLDINGKFIICVSHGAGSPFDIKHRLYKEFIAYKPSIILYGHTHIAADEIYHDIRLFNPGSATSGRDFNSVAVLDVSGGIISAKVIRL